MGIRNSEIWLLDDVRKILVNEWTYLELSFCGKLKREATKGQSENLLIAIINPRVRGPKRLVNLFDCWGNFWRIEHCITVKKQKKSMIKFLIQTCDLIQNFLILHTYIWAWVGLSHVLRWFSVFSILLFIHCFFFPKCRVQCISS